MRKTLLLALSALVLLATVSCNKAGKTGLLVPKDASIVLHIDMASLSSKVDWNEIKQADWFKELGQEETDSLSKQLLNDPEKSGIDTKGQHVMFLKNEGRGAYFAFVGALNDAAAYEKTVTEMNKGKITITKDGELTIGKPDENSVLVWNKSTFILIANSPMGALANMSGMGMGQGRQDRFSADTLQFFAKNILALEGDQLLDGDKRFASLIGEKGDMHFWMNTEKLYGGMIGGMMSMMKVGTLIEGNISTATLNFDEGKIAIKSHQYFGKEMTNLVKKYTPKEVSNDVINRLPSQGVIAAGVFNYPPEGIKALLQLAGLDGVVNGFMGKMNYSVDEFIKANKGDIAFAITDFSIKKDSASYEDYEGKTVYYSRDKTSVNFVAGVSVNDKAAFDKLVGIVVGETAKDPAPGVTYKLDNNWFVAGNDEGHISRFVTGNNKPEYADKIKGHMAGGFVDLQKIMQTYRALPAADTTGNENAAMERKMLEASASFWNYVSFTSDIKNGEAESSFEINLVDKSTNSLKQLIRYAGQMAALKPAKPKNDYDWDAEENGDTQHGTIDSATVAPAK